MDTTGYSETLDQIRKGRQVAKRTLILMTANLSEMEAQLEEITADLTSVANEIGRKEIQLALSRRMYRRMNTLILTGECVDRAFVKSESMTN